MENQDINYLAFFWGIFMFLVIIVSVMKMFFSQWMRKNEPTFFLVLDEIIDDKRWLGKNLTLIRTFNNNGGKYYKNQLLTTRDKKQFIYCEMAISPFHKTVTMLNVKVLNEYEVKELLASHTQEYVDIFGEPTLA